MNLKKAISEFIPFNEQEIKDKEFFLKCIDSCEDVLTRNNELFHFSASAFVINKERNKVLVVYHKIYDNWAFPGGHGDGDSDLLHVALKEVKGETGLDDIPLSTKIYGIESLPTIGHIKRGKYVSAHIHLDAVFLLQADDTKPLSYRKDESKGVKWIPIEETYNKDIVDFIRPVNKKIIQKLGINITK